MKFVPLQAWIGLRSRAKNAYRLRVAYMGGTGGGPHPDAVGLGLSAVHCRVIELIGTVTALGNPVPDPLQVTVSLS